VKHFPCRDVEEAVAYAKSGGQALHTHQIIMDRARAPRCFVAAVDRGEDIAHLFDLDEVRLIATARRLGVRQHIDLCGSPLRKALALCEEDRP
jgi:hypothetical protein